MKIFLHYIKTKPFKIGNILVGNPAKPSDKTNQKIGLYVPKIEGKSEKVELDISKYDELILSGVKATEVVEKLRMTISPPPPVLEVAAAADAESASVEVAA